MKPRQSTARRSGPLVGTVAAPGDKSISHRAVILGSLAEGTTRVGNFLAGEDCLATAAAFRALGVPIRVQGAEVEIEGVGLAGLREPPNVLDLGNSGTGMRLLAGVLAGQPFFSILSGDASLSRRPMRRVVEPLRRMGAAIDGRQDGALPPLAIRGGGLRGLDYESPVASAQVKSCLLLAGLFAEGATSVREPALSRDHSERMLAAFGAELRATGTLVELSPGRTLRAQRLEVPGDLSSAAFFLVAGAIVPGSEIRLPNVGVNPTRVGVLEVLAAMGARVRHEHHRLAAGEPVADLCISAGPLRGVELDHAMVVKAIDEIPILCVAAACAEGVTRIRGAEELRHKESDRLAVMAAALRALGTEVREFPDGLEIAGGRPLGGGCFDSHLDHRIAMSLLVAGLAAEAPVAVRGSECVATSFPTFFAQMRALGASLDEGEAT